MKLFQVKAAVSNPHDTARSFEDRFWVDTGVLYSFVPEDRLKAVGIEPKFTRDFAHADGKRDRRLVGEAALTIQGLDETITCLVVFAPVGSLFCWARPRWRISACKPTQPVRSCGP